MEVELPTKMTRQDLINIMEQNAGRVNQETRVHAEIAYQLSEINETLKKIAEKLK
jgi:hypothetical protein